MRTVFLGTSEFAASVLRALADSPHRPSLVLSRPDRRQGRGRRLAPPPVVLAAREAGIETFQPEAVNAPEVLERIAVARPDQLVLCAFGALVKEPLLSAFGPILNVHPSLLPRWRGAAPIERAILAGDEETGVSIMRLSEGLDSGPVAMQAAVPIAPDDDYGTLAAKLELLGARLLIEALDAEAAVGGDQAGDGEAGGKGIVWREQDEATATYAEKLDSEDRRLDVAAGARGCALRVRALSPHIGAYLELDGGERLGVWQVVEIEGSAAAPELDLSGSLRVEPVWQTSNGALALTVVQPPGGKRMSGADYLRGRTR